ncbi:MAG: 30S ribosomal protein S3 [Candidatus Omnitrophica bacterium]|nr:30S ribosomal protein S3 [Candidatus Omnitrophota bacterium]
MGQKVHPYGLRVGIIKRWKSRWFANKGEFHKTLIEDLTIKKFIKSKLAGSAISNIETERTGDRVKVIIFTARPGVIIGRRGSEIDTLRDQLQTIIGENKQIFIDIKEIKQSSLEAQLIAENIALQLEKRMPYRRAMKKAMQMARDAGCEGMKIKVGGRLGGAEIARKESVKFGKIPLQTLRADIDYGFAEAHTTYGLIGVKVWVYKGERFGMEEVTTGEKENGIDAKARKISQSAKR